MDSQHCGPLDNIPPLLEFRRGCPYGSFARHDVSFLSHGLVAITKTRKPILGGIVCNLGNMDSRPIHGDNQFGSLWRRIFPAGHLALFRFWHAIISVVYVHNVYLRWQHNRPVPHDIAAAHPR